MKLTAAARNELPDSDFAEPEERAYPVNDASHARNALGRVAQNGTPAQQAAVRAKVGRRFPGINLARQMAQAAALRGRGRS